MPLFLAPHFLEPSSGLSVFFGDLRERNPLDVTIQVADRYLNVDAILHRSGDDVVVIEVEMSKGRRPFSFPNTYQAVRSAVSELNQAATLTQLYDITASAVRTLTGFDRVMVYRYDQNFNGEVVAENAREDLEVPCGPLKCHSASGSSTGLV